MELKPEQAVEWLYETRGGWGYQYWIPAIVKKICPKKITIEVKKTTGELKQISVKPERLRLPKAKS